METIILKKARLAFTVVALLKMHIASAQQDFLKLQPSTDSTYGHTPFNPIKLKKGDMGRSMANSFSYLAGLRTMDNQSIRQITRVSVVDPAYEQPGIQLKNRYTGMPLNGKLGMLDKYTFLTTVTKDTVILYIDVYNRSELALPVGFKYEQGLK